MPRFTMTGETLIGPGLPPEGLYMPDTTMDALCLAFDAVYELGVASAGRRHPRLAVRALPAHATKRKSIEEHIQKRADLALRALWVSPMPSNQLRKAMGGDQRYATDALALLESVKAIAPIYQGNKSIARGLTKFGIEICRTELGLTGEPGHPPVDANKPRAGAFADVLAGLP